MGSEMCIRDRLLPDPDAELQLRRGQLRIAMVAVAGTTVADVPGPGDRFVVRNRITSGPARRGFPILHFGSHAAASGLDPDRALDHLGCLATAAHLAKISPAAQSLPGPVVLPPDGRLGLDCLRVNLDPFPIARYDEFEVVEDSPRHPAK